MKKYLSIIAIMALAMLSFTSCGNDTTDSGSTQANVGFYLTDAPIVKGYQAVNLDVKAISYATSADSTQWVSLPIDQSVVEITKLTNGKNLALGNVVLDAGVKVTQIRFVLGNNNTIVLNDGTVKPLNVPSGYTSGLKLNVQSVANLTSGYSVIIDFDAARSIVAMGNGNYSLKPVVRSYIEANTSYVDGYLTPVKEAVRVFTVTSKGDTISTVSDTLNYNYFRVSGLLSGTYTLKAQNLKTDSIYTLQENIPVLGGTNVHLSTTDQPLVIPGIN